jgi:hypothetical protein
MEVNLLVEIKYQDGRIQKRPARNALDAISICCHYVEDLKPSPFGWIANVETITIKEDKESE